MHRLSVALLALFSCTAPETVDTTGAGLDYSSNPDCGPAEAVVEHVIDGDTLRLETDDTVRLLLIDTPETTKGKHECTGAEATDYTAELGLGQTVNLYYDAECRDRYGRLLAYVEGPDGVVNELLLARGYAEVLHIPPNGAEHVEDYQAIESAAQSARRGRWGACH